MTCAASSAHCGLAEVARKKTSKKVTVVRDITIDERRAHLRRTNEQREERPARLRVTSG
jgi:hypothetical protein